ncbi:Alpha/Beta hydrolase protein [Endogone sp. FLAS-F59071]|nr:Alpha/Beta hydrolase protein [Endogone sp. FLAS-F59071]|eukprot:RUS12691.1 Alpha/Beta hydrolase protein [Endogone sp. FLAS-F59071]
MLSFYNSLVFPTAMVNEYYEAARHQQRAWDDSGLSSILSHVDTTGEEINISFYLHRTLVNDLTRARSPNAPRVVLYSHGNAEALDSGNRGFMRELSQRWGCSVAAYDYCGYGDSKGEPTEQNCYRNIEAVWRRLVDEEGFRPENIILLGRSIGTGPTVYLAMQHPEVHKMILISPMKSVIQCVLPFTIPGLDMFPSLNRISQVKVPTLFIHGRADDVIPFSHGEALYHRSQASNRVPVWVDRAGHNDIFVEEVYEGLRMFITT